MPAELVEECLNLLLLEGVLSVKVVVLEGLLLMLCGVYVMTPPPASGGEALRVGEILPSVGRVFLVLVLVLEKMSALGIGFVLTVETM